MHKILLQHRILCIKTSGKYVLRQLSQSFQKLTPKTGISGVNFETHLKIWHKHRYRPIEYTFAYNIC